ncbi:hemagglutinin repeat-containing protein [Comamonas odontotermitis]|uniref:hemagglutinin repeat-containing protein n=1 Tax=Comamonas odontotermitis TaxID=379895 RepID=UPI00366F3C5B
MQINGKDGVYLAGAASANKGLNFSSAQGGITALGPLATAGDLNVQAAQAVRLNSESAATQIAGNTNLSGDTVSISGKFAGGKDVNINAASGASIVGNATIAGNLSMQSGGDSALFGNIQVNQSASVSGRNVSTSGTLTVGENMDILGVQSVDLLGTTTVGNHLGVGGGNVTISGDLDAGQTTVSAQQLNLGGTDGNLNARGDLNLNVSQSFHNTGNVNVSGSFGLTTGGNAQFDGTVSTGSNFGVNAGGDIAINGAVNSGGSTHLNAGNNLQINNTITAGGGVNGTAGGNISVNEQVNSAGSQNWQAGGDFNASQGLQGNNVNVQGSNVNIAGTVLGNGAVTIAANNNLQLGNEVRANGNVNLSSAQGGIVAQSVFSNGSVDVRSPGSVNVQTVQATSDISLVSTANQITAQTLLAGRDLTLNAQDRIAVSGDVGAGRNVAIASSQAGVQLAQASAGENLSIAASQAVQIAGGVSAGGNATLTSTNSGLSAQAILASGDINTQAMGDIVVAGEVASGANARIASSSGKVDLGGSLYGAQSVDVEGKDIRLAQGLQSGGAATVVATAGNINSDAGIAAMGNVLLQSAGTSTIGGSVQSATSITLQSAGDTRISGDVIAQQNLQTQIGGALVATNVAAGGNAQIAADSITLNELQVGGQANLQAKQDISVAQNLMAGSVVTQSVTGNTTIGGQVGTAGALAMASGGNIVAGDIVAGVANADAASITATGSVQLNSLRTGGDYVGRAGQNHVVANDMAIQGHADVQAGGDIQAGLLSVGNGLQAQAGGNIVVNGDALVIGNAQLQSGGAQQIAGNLQVTDQLLSNAQGGLQVTGDLIANNGLQVTSTAGALNVGGLLGTQGAALVNANQGVQVGGDVLANAVQFTSSGGGVAVGGNLSSQGDASLQAQQDIAVAGKTAVMGNLQAASSAGSITFADDLQVAGDFSGHANKDLNFLGDSLLLGQTDLKADTGRINNQGNMTFGQAVNINTTGDFVNEGTIQSQGDITVSARNIDSNLAQKGGIATGGNLSLTASGMTRQGQNGTFNAAEDITLQAASGTQAAGTIAAGQDLHYTGGTLASSGTVVAQNADIDAALANQGNVYIQNNLNVTGSATNSGEIAAKTLTMASLDNSGKVGAQSVTLGATNNSGEIAADTVDISGGLSNTGAVSGGSSVSVSGGSTSNDGTIAGGTVSLAGAAITNGGQIQSSGAMIIAGGTFENRLQESKSCTQPSGCTTPDTYEYSQTPGSISAGGTLNINVANATNKGVIHAGSDITINGALNNERSTNDPYTSAGAGGGAVSGIISAGGNLNVTGPSVQNSGQLQAGNAVQITSSGAFNNAAPTEDVAGQVIGKSVKVTAGSINNDGMVLAQAGNADLTANSGALTNNGTIAATSDLNLTAASDAVSNSKDGKILGKNIAIKGNSFSNAGIVYGQNAPPSKISIETTGGFSNAATGIVIAGEKLDIKAGTYSNTGGTVGSLQDATLTMAGNYAPAGNALVALGKLDLQVGGISVGVGESWNVASTDVNWTGTLTNQGTVAIKGNASGNISNEATGTRDVNGAPDVLHDPYRVDTYPTGLTGAQIIGYTDVAHRAQLYIGGAFTGSLENIASDARVGGNYSVNQVNLDQKVTWEGKDSGGNTVQVQTDALSMARLDTGPGYSEITLTGPNTGTIVGDSLVINGGSITINPGIDPATGLPLVAGAQGTQVNAGNAQAGNTADTTTGNIKPLAVNDPNAAGSTNVATTDTSGAGSGAGNNGGAGDTGSAGTPVAGNGDGPTPTPPARTLNLKDPIFQTPEGAVAVLMGSGFNPKWPDWNQLRVVPGGISANDLQLNLSGQFVNHGQLDVTNQLIINAAEGIDNFGASIRAGGTASLNGKYLNNDNGLIQARTLVTDIKGDISNNRGRIVASNGGFLQAGGNIAANEGQFISDAGKFVLDAGGDIDLIASKVEGKQGVGLNAGGNINLGAKQTTQTVHANKNLTETQAWNNSASGSDTFVEGTSVIENRQASTTTTTTSVGTTIQSGEGSVAIAAGGKLAITGGGINAGKDVLLKGADVTVQAAKESTVTTKEQTRTADGRETDRETSTTRSESYSGGTVTAGGKVAIIADGGAGTDASKSGGNVLLSGSQIEGKQGVGISATGNVDLQALKADSSATYSGKQTTLANTRTEGESTGVTNHSAVVSSKEGDVQIAAKGDVGIIGSNLTAGKDIVVKGASVTVQAAKDSAYTNDYEKSGRKEHRLAQSNETLKGGEITADGGITLIANGTPVPKPANPRTGTGTPDDPVAVKPTEISSGKGSGNITLQGATVTAKGNTALIASGDVNLLDVQTGHDRYEESYSKSSGFLSSKRTTTVDTGHSSLSEGSVVQGKDVTINAGQNINLRGSHVVATGDIGLLAGGDINVLAGKNTAQGESFSETKKSGLFSNGLFSWTLGSSTVSSTHNTTSEVAAASSLQAMGGSVNVVAGGHYQQTGSAVLAEKDVSILAKSVDITEAREIEKDKFETRAKQSGLTLSISSPIISAIQTGTALGNAMGKTSDARALALGAATTGLYAYNNAQAIGQSAQALTDGNPAAGLNISLTLGSSQSQSTQNQEKYLAAGSTVHGNGNVTIKATGAGQDSNIRIQGSNVSADKDLTLAADNKIDLLAAKNTVTNRGENSSSSAAVGVALQLGGNGVAAGITASASGGRGHQNSDDVYYTNTNISAGNNLTIQSGGDTTLRGAVAQGKKVTANVGGDLKLESLQDTSKFDGKQQSLGGSITVGAGVAGSVSYSSSKANGDYASVTEQTAIRAGDGGFDITVKGNTDLKGAAITSTQKAVDSNANSLTTGSLTVSSIENHDNYSASGINLSGGVSLGGKDPKEAGGQPSTVNNGTDWSWQNPGKPGVSGAAAGVSSDRGQQNSTTHSAVSAGAVTITGAGQNSGQVLASLNRDARTGDDGKAAGSLNKTWDGPALMAQQQANAQIYAMFGQQATRAVGDYAQSQLNKADGLRREAAQLDDNDPRKAQLNQQAQQLDSDWGSDGKLRVLAHTVVGGLTGGVQGAAGAAAGTLTAPAVAQALQEAGITGPLADTIVAAASTAVGAVAGGASGAAAAANEVTNNYLKHEDVIRIKQQLTQCSDKECRDKVIQNAYITSAANDLELLGCKANNSCDTLKAEYSKGTSTIEGLLDAGISPNDVGKLLNLQSNGATIIRGNLYDRQCNTPECVDKAKFLLGLSQGLSYLTPAGAVAGAGQIAYNLTTAIINNGGEATAIAVIQGIKGLPENIMAGLMSDDPRVRGETLVTALTIPVVAAAVGRKVGVTVLENIGTGPAAGSRTAQRGGVNFGNGDADSAGGKPNSGGTSQKPSVAVQGGTVELFTDSRGPQVPGAVGVGPTTPGAVATDATNMPSIPSGSQATVVANNPFIPKDAGGTFSMMDYLPEATRITQQGGEIIVNGTIRNPYVKLPSLSQLDELGLKVIYQGPLKPEFQGGVYRTTEGAVMPVNSMQTIIFVKK